MSNVVPMTPAAKVIPVPETVVVEIMNYLAQRPWVEANPLLGHLQRAIQQVNVPEEKKAAE